MDPIALGIGIAAGAAAGGAAAWLAAKSRYGALAARAEGERDLLKEEGERRAAALARLEEERTGHLARLAALETANARLEPLENELERLRLARLELDREQARLEEALDGKRTALEAALEAHGGVERENRQLKEELSRRREEAAELETRMAEQRKQAEEKLALLTEAKERLGMEFANLANKIFDEKSKKFGEQSKAGLENLLNPFKEQIGAFGKKVEEAYDKEARDKAGLAKEIQHLKELNRRIGEDALNLTNALKGQTKTQGTWGEVILERVLEQSGLEKGREYEVQASLKNEEGRRFQPDVIVHLPENKQVVVDSKVSLVAYERYVNAETDEERDHALRQHLASVQAHVKGLSAKNYEGLEGIRTLDFVLMFVPVEGAFMTALEQGGDLFRGAFEKNIIIVSPSTLLVTLRTIQNIWRYEKQNQNALEIAKRAGDLYDKFVGFVEELEKLGTHLDRARSAYEGTHKKLVSGTGSLVNRARTLEKLGVKGKKQLSSGQDEGEEEVS